VTCHQYICLLYCLKMELSISCTASCLSILPTIILYACIIKFLPAVWLFFFWSISSATEYLASWAFLLTLTLPIKALLCLFWDTVAVQNNQHFY
jgi:hypothetical protein